MKNNDVYFDEELSRYVIEKDLIKINEDGKVDLPHLIDVLQDHRNAWERLNIFTQAQTRSNLFKVAHTDYTRLPIYTEFLVTFAERVFIDESVGLIYVYSEGKVPATQEEILQYKGPSIQNPLATYTVTDKTPLQAFYRMVVDYPTDRILKATIATDVGHLLLPNTPNGLTEKEFIFEGSIRFIREQLATAMFIPGEDTANVVLIIDDLRGNPDSIVSATMRISGYDEPLTPTLSIVPEIANFGTSYANLVLANAVQFTGTVADVAQVKFTSTKHQARLSTSTGNVIATDYAPSVILDPSKYGNSLNGLKIDVVRNGAEASDSTISVEYTLNEAHEFEVLIATLQVLQEDHGIPSIGQASEIVIPTGENSVTVTDLFTFTNIDSADDASTVVFSSEEFSVDIFYSDTNFLRASPGDPQTFGGDPYNDILKSSKIRINRLGEEARSGSFNITIKVGYTEYVSTITFNQEVLVAPPTVVPTNAVTNMNGSSSLYIKRFLEIQGDATYEDVTSLFVKSDDFRITFFGINSEPGVHNTVTTDSSKIKSFFTSTSIVGFIYRNVEHYNESFTGSITVEITFNEKYNNAVVPVEVAISQLPYYKVEIELGASLHMGTDSEIALMDFPPAGIDRDLLGVITANTDNYDLYMVLTDPTGHVYTEGMSIYLNEAWEDKWIADDAFIKFIRTRTDSTSGTVNVAYRNKDNKTFPYEFYGTVPWSQDTVDSLPAVYSAVSTTTPEISSDNVMFDGYNFIQISALASNVKSVAIMSDKCMVEVSQLGGDTFFTEPGTELVITSMGSDINADSIILRRWSTDSDTDTVVITITMDELVYPDVAPIVHTLNVTQEAWNDSEFAILCHPGGKTNPGEQFIVNSPLTVFGDISEIESISVSNNYSSGYASFYCKGRYYDIDYSDTEISGPFTQKDLDDMGIMFRVEANQYGSIRMKVNTVRGDTLEAYMYVSLN